MLWALAGIRLMFPFSLESMFSLVPSAETIPQDIMYAQTPAIHSGVAILNSTLNPILESSFTPEPGASVNPLQVVSLVMSSIWLVGIVVMLLYACVSYWRVKKKVRESIPMGDNVYFCDKVESPFILGVIKPHIYVPADLPESEIVYVIAHEKAHIKRFDHVWKPLGFLILTVYWFNPVLWIAYILLCRDIELACDEKVIGKLGLESKKPYSMALLNCSVSRKSIAACPLAFGEVNVKNRIKTVLNYKKPAFWLIVLAVLVSGMLAVAFLTDPVTSDVSRITDEKGYYILEQNEYEFTAAIPKDVLTEEAFTSEGQSFEKEEVIVYSTDTTNVYLEKVMLSNESDEWLYMVFNCSYHDLDKNSLVLLPYVKSDKGYTGTIKLKNEELADGMAFYEQAVSMRAQGPSEKFAIYADAKIVKNAWKYIEVKFVANELLYSEEAVEANVQEEVVDDLNAFYTIELAGKTFRGEEVIYGTRIIDSFVYTDETMPVFVLKKEDLHLLTNDFPEPSFLSSYYDIGQIQKVDLELSVLEHLLDDEFNPWKQGYSAEELYRENKNTYMVTEEGQEYNRFYYILEQKNGDVYIAYGWEGEGIRYIFKMHASEENLGVNNSVSYVFENGNQWDYSIVTLNPDERSFSFSESSLSSYLGYGTYTVEDNCLVLRTDDGIYTYKFEIVGDGYLSYNGNYYMKINN